MRHLTDELTKDGEGYVYWRGVQVEHYSFGENHQGETEAAVKMALWCRRLEALGIEVSGNTAVWYSDWFEGVTHPMIERGILNPRWAERCPGLYEHEDGRQVAVVFAGRYQQADETLLVTDEVVHWFDGEIWQELALEPYDAWDETAEWDFRGMEARGFHPADLGQGKDLGVVYGSTTRLLDFIWQWRIFDAGIGLPEVTAVRHDEVNDGYLLGLEWREHGEVLPEGGWIRVRLARRKGVRK